MIKLFGATDKLYSNNGDLVLQTIKAKVHKEDNGDFYINVEAPLSENEKSLPALAGTTVTGKNFTLNNVDRFKEVEITNIDGDTNQEETPTPSTPQPINVVSGRQEVVVCGKNLFNTLIDKNTGYTSEKNGITQLYNDNGSITLSGTATAQTDLYITTATYGSTNNNFILDNNTSYTLSLVGNTNNNIQIIIGYGSSAYNTATTKTITPNNNISWAFIRIANGTNLTTPITIYPQLEKGNASSYEAYTGQSYEINLGKNLCPAKTFTSLSSVRMVSEATTGGATVYGIPVVAGQTYTASFDITVLPSTDYRMQLINSSNATQTQGGADPTNIIERQQITCNQLQRYSVSITTTQAGYLYLRCVPVGFTLDNIQIEKGNATSYAPYKTPIELCEKDKIYKDSGKWYIEKKTNKIASYNGETITTDYISTTGELTTGATIYYVLATPTTTEITDLELINQLNSLKLLEGLNNISITSADLVGTYTIHYNYREAQSTKINYIDYLVPNNIIVANTPQGDQAFRISNVENTRSKIKIKAYHVFYDSENYLIKDTFIVDKNCNDALDQLNNNTDNISPFTTISDITKIASYRCVRKSLYEAIQVLLERYGGHLVRDNWTIGIRANIGQDNGVTIRYGKNLKDIKATYNWDSVCTKLLPVGKDGLLLNALDPTASVYLESATQYEIPYTKSVNFDQNDISEEDYKDEETGEVDEEAYTQALINDLAEKGQNYLQNNSTPVVNYTLNANVEKVSDIGDTIQVIDEKLGISLLTNIISYEYDCILDKYTQIEFGNFTQTLSGLMGNISNQIQQTVDESTATLQITLGQELQEAQDKIWNALGSSYVIYEGDKILVVDSLPKETATNVIMINNGGIGFSNNGINGTFNSAWTIDNILNMEQINVINLTADLIKGGTLKLGNNLNQNGQLEVYDEANSLIAQLNKDGLKMYGVDGSYILMNNTVGFSGYDRLGNQIYWVSKDEFHQKKSVVEEEITLCNKLRFIPITITDGNNNIVNDGIGLVSVAGGGN